MPDTTISQVIDKIDRFRWQNYLKDYHGDLQRIQSIYWHTVINDMYVTLSKPLKPESDLSPFAKKIFRSYQGIFMWPHICYSEILKRFNGLSFFSLKNDKDLWDKWKTSNKYRMLESMAKIYSVQIQDDQNPYVNILTDPRFGGDFNWQEFDSYHTNKTPPISYFLKKHLTPGSFYFTNKKSPLIYFRVSLRKPLIDQLHSNGQQLSKSLIFNSVFTEIDNQSTRYEQEVELNRREKLYNRPVERWVQTAKHADPTMAIKDALKINPEYRDLPRAYIKHFIQARYRDKNGKPLKNNSLDRALKRQGFL